MENEKHSLSEPGPEDPSELVRRYRASGVHSSHRPAGGTFLGWLRREPVHSRHRSKHRRSSSAQTPEEAPKADRKLTYEERRQREKARSRRRNKRLMARKRAAALKQLALNAAYLLVAACLAWLILSSAIGGDQF